MLDIIIYFIGFIITAPVAATVIVYLISFQLYNHRWKAIHKSVNWTTLLYIIAVAVLFRIIFGNSFIGILFVLLISIFIFIAVAQWKINTEVVFNNIFKIFWRICFLLFLFLYIILVIFGIIQRLFFQ
ncbi:DUF3397 domain-containing protein [Virgibacillus doumboii]|uniref:DUF3397 domain-containing protein n=1 Tax=Virgibacillus doumboii TaxID=2697503 RepID=UPI0013DEC6A4